MAEVRRRMKEEEPTPEPVVQEETPEDMAQDEKADIHAEEFAKVLAKFLEDIERQVHQL